MNLQELTEFVKLVGSENPLPDQYDGIKKENDSYMLMQYYAEYADFLYYMINNYSQGFDLTLCVGIGAGGEAHLFRDFIPCKRTIVIDDGSYPAYDRWSEQKKLIKTKLTDIKANSYSVNVFDELKKLNVDNKLEYAFIDGWHEEKFVRNDIELTRSIAKNNCLIALHDTNLLPGASATKNQMAVNGNFELLYETKMRYGIALFRMKDSSIKVFEDVRQTV